ncbi:MAG: hypothetical protein M1825_006485 [Sarcosagium campestre]|nr:MAG: hypothetical protein M1825_006485 [Sarcosagium campestre]
MGSKRSDDRMGDPGDVHPSRKALVPKDAPRWQHNGRQQRARRNRSEIPSSINQLKTQIRNITRRLQHSPEIPANVKQDDERALETYRTRLEVAIFEKRRREMIKKYHMVRFFERQKATRQIKKLQKQLTSAETTEDAQLLNTKLHVAEVDLKYAQYCPLDQKYISLYADRAKQETGGADEDSTYKGDKPPLWAEVERRMEEGTLDALRNGDSGSNLEFTSLNSSRGRSLDKRRKKVSRTKPDPRDSVGSKPTADGTPHERNGQISSRVGDDDESSDGGFFEEI